MYLFKENITLLYLSLKGNYSIYLRTSFLFNLNRVPSIFNNSGASISSGGREANATDGALKLESSQPPLQLFRRRSARQKTTGSCASTRYVLVKLGFIIEY